MDSGAFTASCGGDKTVGEKVLVAYASRFGSTGEVAEVIGKVLAEAGAAVDVRSVKEVKDLSPYTSVIIGSAAQTGKLLPEAVDFARKHQADLSHMQTAYFTVGVAMIEDTPDNRKEAASYLEPLCQIKEPVSLGLFAGKVDPSKYGLVMRLIFSRVKKGPMAPGDHRNWEAIRAWARELAPQLAG